MKDTVRPKFDSLEAVFVHPKTVPVLMKGDTLEYNTENVLLRANAAVEELLRRLPGLSIDADGNITYNGEKIRRLLVDGEDLFGSSPQMVTRNFNADMIARVQVLNRQSDQAAFTGIDDGQRTKTLNLVLKESSKNGYFGKVGAGGGQPGVYNMNGLLGSFRDREQFTALGIASNTGSMVFGGDPGGSALSLNAAGNVDELGASAGKGIPRYLATAVHYANTWNGNDDHVMGNYQFSHLYTRPVTMLTTLQTLPDSVYSQRQQNSSINRQDQHWMYGLFDYLPDSVSALKFGVHGSNTDEENQFTATGNSAFNGTQVNSSQRSIQSRANLRNMGENVSWRIRAQKQPARTFSATLGLARIDHTTSGFLYSLNTFYQPNGSLQSVDTVDQRKQFTTHEQSATGSVNYTQPLWKNALLGLSYSLSYDQNNSLQATYNKGDGKYQEYVDSLSSHYQDRTLTQQFTMNLQGKSPQLHYTIGGNIFRYNYRQQDLLVDSLVHFQYGNLNPRVLGDYLINPYSILFFNYSGSTQEPTVAQLQSVRNNNDPLHVVIGNPGLHPSYDQDFSLRWQRLKPVMLNLSLSYRITSNSISTRTFTDSLGRQISQSVNTDGAKSAGLNFTVNKRLESLGIDAGVNGNVNYARSVNFINTDLSRNDVYTAGSGFILAKNVPDRFSINLTAGIGYFDAISSINTASTVRYWTQNHSGSLTLLLFRQFEFNTTATYTWQEKTSAFAANVSVLLWNTYLSRNFLQNRLVVKAQFNNILDENAGISRSSTGNINTESSTNILGRYWMLSAAYHFNHKNRAKGLRE